MRAMTFTTSVSCGWSSTTSVVRLPKKSRPSVRSSGAGVTSSEAACTR
jgi:hypothetical protein